MKAIICSGPFGFPVPFVSSNMHARWPGRGACRTALYPRDNARKTLRAVPDPVMPVGVEHLREPWPHAQPWIVPDPVMPVGVEHMSTMRLMTY
jgi:hypothetical protein